MLEFFAACILEGFSSRLHLVVISTIVTDCTTYIKHHSLLCWSTLCVGFRLSARRRIWCDSLERVREKVIAMTNIMASPEECRYPRYQLSFFPPHHDPSTGNTEYSEPRLPPRQSSHSLDWDASNLQATTFSAAVLQDEPHCNYAASSSQTAAVTQYSWAKALLLDCARAIADRDAPRVQSIMWILNESASPYGDSDQRLVSYFVQALFCKISGTGARCHRSLTAAAEKTYCFESMRNMILEFQDASPWTTFGHVAGNGALLEAMEGEARIHIVDISSTFCTQWPTFLEALATRTEVTPHLRLTTIVISNEEAALRVMKQVVHRLERFARLMGVPFEGTVLHQPQLELLDLATLSFREGEALAINCVQTLHHISECVTSQEQPCCPRDRLLFTFRNAYPKILIVVEDEANLVWPDFVDRFSEALRFYSLFFDSLDESFPRASNERLMLERNCARKLVNMLSCDPSESIERQETGVHWESRLRQVGFEAAPFSLDVVDDVQALLKRYKTGWGLDTIDGRVYLTWKEQAVVCSTAWKLVTSPSP